MKWSIVALIAVGVAAALCAALLVSALRAGDTVAKAPQSCPAVDVLVASEKLPLMTVLEAKHIARKTVRADEAPEDCLQEPLKVIGKLLAAPMVAGQPFTKQCFTRPGKGATLASALPEGMRAVSISLTSYGGLRGLIYPGGIVDVLVSFTPPAGDSQSEELMSMTLLQSVQVLAVEDQTVASQEDGASMGLTGRSRKMLVTVMLACDQARALQLALERGAVSLAMRNPFDSETSSDGPTLLSDLSHCWGEVSAPVAQPAVVTEAHYEQSLGRNWETTVIRGAKSEKCVIPINGRRDAGSPL